MNTVLSTSFAGALTEAAHTPEQQQEGAHLAPSPERH